MPANPIKTNAAIMKKNQAAEPTPDEMRSHSNSTTASRDRIVLRTVRSLAVFVPWFLSLTLRRSFTRQNR